MNRTLVWFRGKELRLSDHAPLGGYLPELANVPTKYIHVGT